MARLMHVEEIAAPKELIDHGISKTPLWYYCLREAESHDGKLGPVGGTIVAGTLLRLLSLDPDSLLCSAHDFKPWTTLGASKAGNFLLGDMLSCVEAGRDAIAHADDLITGKARKRERLRPESLFFLQKCGNSPPHRNIHKENSDRETQIYADWLLTPIITAHNVAAHSTEYQGMLHLVVIVNRTRMGR